jgi:hypothetical protein
MQDRALDLFDSRQRAVLLARIAAWQAEDRAQWGRLDALAAVSHCQQPLRVALDELELPRTWLGRILGRGARRSLLGPAPMARNLPTDPHFRVAAQGTFDAERARLLELARRFGERGAALVPHAPHPFFGALSAVEWSLLMGKHLDHHLRQFGR